MSSAKLLKGTLQTIILKLLEDHDKPTILLQFGVRLSEIPQSDAPLLASGQPV